MKQPEEPPKILSLKKKSIERAYLPKTNFKKKHGSLPPTRINASRLETMDLLRKHLNLEEDRSIRPDVDSSANESVTVKNFISSPKGM